MNFEGARSAEDAETVGDAAYRRIRGDILHGRLAPGIKLKLDRLRDAYGAGLSTLREILNRLVSEKLVVAEGQRGFEVAPVSAANLREIAELRLLIEREGLRRSFTLGDAAWLTRVGEAHAALVAAGQTREGGDVDDPSLWVERDIAFHRALVSACGSKVLIASHAAVCERYLRYQIIAVRLRDDLTAQEHAQFVEAARQGDAAAAEDLLGRHIARAIEKALQTGLIT